MKPKNIHKNILGKITWLDPPVCLNVKTKTDKKFLTILDNRFLENQKY